LARREKEEVMLRMKTTGMKVLAIGLIVLLFSEILGLYYAWNQFDLYVIRDEYLSSEEINSLITGFLFSQLFSVIGILIVVIGMLMLLKVPQKQVESKASQ